jgi:hypothetical protein
LAKVVVQKEAMLDSARKSLAEEEAGARQLRGVLTQADAASATQSATHSALCTERDQLHRARQDLRDRINAIEGRNVFSVFSLFLFPFFLVRFFVIY